MQMCPRRTAVAAFFLEKNWPRAPSTAHQGGVPDSPGNQGSPLGKQSEGSPSVPLAVALSVC